jgi:hypothetical protein
VAADDDRPPVLVQTRYDRFPATVKGAFVLRGGDANPHIVRVVRAAIDAVAGGEAKDIPMGGVDVDVAPGRDLFVPFETSIAELDPGWYVVASEIEVDGGPGERSVSRPFSVAWPRGEVRTGSVAMDEPVRVGDASFRVDRAELKSDRVILVWKTEGEAADEAGAAEVDLRVEVSADGRELAAVPRAPGSDPKPGEGRSVHYPAPHGASALEVVFVSPSGDRSEILRAPIG